MAQDGRMDRPREIGRWMLTGRGFRDNIDAVARGEVDPGITTPLDMPLE